jgi:hypothetical protein
VSDITPERVRELLQAATPGPWEHDLDPANSWYSKGCGSVYTLDEHLMGGNIAAPNGDLYPRSGYSPKGDMALIAAAPEIAQAYLELVERLAETEGKVTYLSNAVRLLQEKPR